MILGHPKWKKADLPVAATFVSRIKEHVIHLEAAESTVNLENIVQRTPNTGLKVKFEDNRLVIRNSMVLNKLLKHGSFNNPRFGFTIDPEDPTGFWRACGVVEEDVVHTFKVKPQYDVNPTKIDREKLKKIDPEKLNKLQVV